MNTRPRFTASQRLKCFEDHGAIVLCQGIDCDSAMYVKGCDIDHWLALVDGGQHVQENFRPLCSSCHRIKSAHEHKENARAKRRAAKHSGQDQKPTREDLRKRLAYDPGTGRLSWRVGLSGRYGFAGTVAGGGYRRVRWDGRAYAATHIIWAMMTGTWPSNQVDHINHNRDDNRWENLREATSAQQQANLSRAIENYSGIRGVRFNPARKMTKTPWFARITIDGKRRYLGAFATKDEAAEAYRAAAEKHFGEYFNTKLAQPKRQAAAQ